MGSKIFGGSSKKKSETTTTTAPSTQYAPYVDQAIGSAQQIFNANQPKLADLGTKALDVYNGLGGAANTAAGLAAGTNPAQATYGRLSNAAANDPSMGLLKSLATENYTNPATSLLTGMAGSGSNGDTSSYYKRLLNPSYSTANPFVDAIAKQGEDAALKAVNQRFAASGIGEGMSTPYADVASKNVADAGNQIRYQNYNDAEARALQAAGMSDSEYNTTQARNLAAAQALGSTAQADRAEKRAAAQALGEQNNANNTTSLNAAHDNVDGILSALQLQGGLGSSQLNALGAAGSLPYTGLNSYADLINALTGRYGTTNSKGTETVSGSPGVLGGLGQLVSLGSDIFSLGSKIGAFK